MIERIPLGVHKPAMLAPMQFFGSIFRIKYSYAVGNLVYSAATLAGGKCDDARRHTPFKISKAKGGNP